MVNDFKKTFIQNFALVQCKIVSHIEKLTILKKHIKNFVDYDNITQNKKLFIVQDAHC